MTKIIANVPRKLAPIFFVIDTSGAMCGESIAAVNEGMELLISAMAISEDDFFFDNDVALGVLSFSTDAVWEPKKGLEKVKDFIWSGLCAGGVSNVGFALRELDEKLSRKVLFSEYGCLRPTIFFIFEGYSSDNYLAALQALRQNRWYQSSQKICVSYNFADEQMIRSVIGDKEGIIITAESPVTLKNIIVNEFPKYLNTWVIGPKKNAERQVPINNNLPLNNRLSDSMRFPEFVDDDDNWE